MSKLFNFVLLLILSCLQIYFTVIITVFNAVSIVTAFHFCIQK